MAKEIKTHVYKLMKGNNTDYIGTTKDLERRKQEHKDDGKKFDKMEKVSTHNDVGSAKRKERELLTEHRNDNGGKNPKHNKDPNG